MHAGGHRFDSDILHQSSHVGGNLFEFSNKPEEIPSQAGYETFIDILKRLNEKQIGTLKDVFVISKIRIQEQGVDFLSLEDQH